MVIKIATVGDQADPAPRPIAGGQGAAWPAMLGRQLRSPARWLKCRWGDAAAGFVAAPPLHLRPTGPVDPMTKATRPG